ncbi:MAG: hypothetical protein R3301_15180, partial [Saprospiraceae bacterium]|nr:hypothetical protein [Saprospiraceae bacterium]
MTRLLLVILLLTGAMSVWANGAPVARVHKISEPVTLDGNLDEAVWSRAQAITGFWQHFPTDSLLSDYQTEVYLLYDDQRLYIGARCYAPGPNFIVPSLKRDYRAGGNDNIT